MLIFLPGRRPVKCEAKTTNIRHYKCPGGHRAHREEEQELHQVEGEGDRSPGLVNDDDVSGSRCWGEHTGGHRQNLTAD